MVRGCTCSKVQHYGDAKIGGTRQPRQQLSLRKVEEQLPPFFCKEAGSHLSKSFRRNKISKWKLHVRVGNKTTDKFVSIQCLKPRLFINTCNSSTWNMKTWSIFLAFINKLVLVLFLHLKQWPSDCLMHCCKKKILTYNDEHNLNLGWAHDEHVNNRNGTINTHATLQRLRISFSCRWPTKRYV